MSTPKHQHVIQQRAKLLQQFPIQQEHTLISNDKFFVVCLKSLSDDGSTNYLTNVLVKNFMQMFPPSYSAKAWVYSVEILPDKSLELNGLIRYDGNNKYNITPKSSHIKNIIIKEGTKIKNTRDYIVETLTQYRNKKYVTNMITVMNKYRSVVDNNSRTFVDGPCGDDISKFLSEL